MFKFLKENYILIFLAIGSVLPFILSVYEKIAEKKKMRVVLILLSTGFIISLCIIIISDMQQKNSKKISEELENKKKEMIDQISTNVSAGLETSIETMVIAKQSLTLLENLEAKLIKTPFKEVAVELVSKNYDRLHVFEKGDPSKFPEYLSWLEATLNQPGRDPVLAFIVNANRHYVVGLILAYLLANGENQDQIMKIIRAGPSAWRRFPDNRTLDFIGEIYSKVKFVLFYNGSKDRFLGFADAAMFTKELLLYQTRGLASDIESILNLRGGASAEIMQKTFSSFSPMVFKADNVYEAARQLIEKKENNGITLYQEKPWFLNLAKVIKIAT